MNANGIIKIMERIDKLPYKCILFDGKWGIGKSYAIEEAVKGKDNVCEISLFGLENSQYIYHEILFQFLLKDGLGGSIGTEAKKVLDACALFSGKIAKVKAAVDSVLAERELFLAMTKKFEKYHIIILDDVERISDSVNFQEVLGIVEELKKCNYVKVVLIANSEELNEDNKKLLEKYCEKVIDRDYNITEKSEEINWASLGIDASFITNFLRKHSVSNLRTLQKAQNFYDDVKVLCAEVGNEVFQEEIRLVCYAIVVEDTDALYYSKNNSQNNDAVSKIMVETSNRFDNRLLNYLREIKSSKSLIDLIYRYYINQANIQKEELEVQFKLFSKAGKKPNFYKTDEEISEVLDEWKNELENISTIGALNHIVDEYVLWSQIIGRDYSVILEKYKEMLHTMLWDTVQTGDESILNYSGAMLDFSITTDVIKEHYNVEIEKLRRKIIDFYIDYLKQRSEDKIAFNYSYKLRQYYDNVYYKEIIDEQIEELLLRSSFPVDNMNENKYHTCYNILAVLYKHDRDILLKYCDELIEQCDGMAKHRIKRIMEEVMR